MQEQDIYEQHIDQHIPIRKTLTYEELEIAVNYLKKRFPHWTIQHIVDSMNQHHELRKQRSNLPHNYYQQQENHNTAHSPAQEREVHQANVAIQPAAPRESREEKKIRQKQELKLVSTLFCERGNDFSYAKTFLPELTPTTYKNKLVSIMGSVVKELLVFIKKQCKTNPPELTQNQLFTIKSALISAHEWMALKSAAALQTFFNFITKINVNRHKMINKEEAIQLYNVIAARVNDKSLDLLFLQPEDEFGNQIEQKVRPSHKEVRSFSSQSQIRELIAQTFLEFCSFEKVSNFLLNKYGLDARFDQDNINLSLRHIVEAAISKINNSQSRSPVACTPRLLHLIFQQQNRNILYALVQIFLRKTDDKAFYRQVISKLLKLQNNQRIVHQQIEQSEDDRESQGQPEPFLDESVQRQEQFVNGLQNEERVSCENRYDTDCIFEQMFEVLLPKQNKSRSQRRSTASSKKEALAQSVLYFDE